jgi:hypothetical protein
MPDFMGDCYRTFRSITRKRLCPMWTPGVFRQLLHYAIGEADGTLGLFWGLCSSPCTDRPAGNWARCEECEKALAVIQVTADTTNKGPGGA